jgi:aspartyl-tRNA(Asn)/glutamyl-tRNA(Gln) amidotransferase subunit A
MRPNQSTNFNSVEHTQQSLAKIDDTQGEGKRTFLKVYRETALAQATFIDVAKKAGQHISPLAGLTVSIKDLFDVAGDVTTAGSIALRDAPPATVDAPIVQRLRAAGAVIIGRTNMTEFAYGGIGMNVHYQTPASPFERAKNPRVPGGSSSGAAVSVTDGMAWGAIGSDTGGSTRIPAAFCGIVGFKPTQARISRNGAIPLSTTLDSIGPLAKSVADCALLDACMAGEPMVVPQPYPLKGLRIGIPKTIVFDGLDAAVAAAIEAAMNTLSQAGAVLMHFDAPEFADVIASYSKATFSGAEAWAWHRELFSRKADQYDWRVRKRLEQMQNITSADYIDLLKFRSNVIEKFTACTAPFDVLLMPTVPIIAPTIASLEADEALFFKTQPLTVRNCQLINFINGCAISLPCHHSGEAPVGLMLAGVGGTDKRLLSIAMSVEALFGV